MKANRLRPVPVIEVTAHGIADGLAQLLEVITLGEDRGSDRPSRISAFCSFLDDEDDFSHERLLFTSRNLALFGADGVGLTHRGTGSLAYGMAVIFVCICVDADSDWTRIISRVSYGCRVDTLLIISQSGTGAIDGFAWA